MKQTWPESKGYINRSLICMLSEFGWFQLYVHIRSNYANNMMLGKFVSDHFGGSDKSLMVDMAPKSISGSNYKKPFVCTCPTGNNKDVMKYAARSIRSAKDTIFLNMCEKSF